MIIFSPTKIKYACTIKLSVLFVFMQLCVSSVVLCVTNMFLSNQYARFLIFIKSMSATLKNQAVFLFFSSRPRCSSAS